MVEDKRATFAKVEFDNGEKAKIVYSFRLERVHWIFAILASVAAIAISLVVLRGAVYGSVREVAGEEFATQLRTFHTIAKPAIRILVTGEIKTAFAEHAHDEHKRALEHAEALAEISSQLARLDERLNSIDRRLAERRNP